MKVFISYSWSNKEHEDWVLRLATELRDSGVDAILDKWDLKEGHDANQFMEQMVSDPEVKKVIIISDQTYSEKSNARKGGAGTEAQIISQEIYSKQKQDKFVVVTTQLDDEGKPFLPVYYSSRIFIDFSNPSQFSNSFDQLLRWVTENPVNKKPALGKLPIYLTKNDTTIALATGASQKRAINAMIKSETYALAATKDYLKLFIEEMEKFRFESNFDGLSDQVVENFESFIPARNELIELFQTISNYTTDIRFGEAIHLFFEQIRRFFIAPNNYAQHYKFGFDNFKFFAQELFLHCNAIFLAETRSDLFNTLVEQEYFDHEKFERGLDAMLPFAVFRHYPDLLKYRQDNSKTTKWLSPTGNLIKERTVGSLITFQQIMQIDFILYLRSLSVEASDRLMWWPDTLIYVGFSQKGFEIFQRARSESYFKKIRPFLGGMSKSELETLIEKIESNSHLVPKWDFDTISPAALANVKDLCCRP